MHLTALLALITTVVALPAPDAAAAPADDVTILATHKWQAVGGCKTDWNIRCHQQCIGEAKTKGFTCTNVDSDITSQGCFVGWNTCECTYFN